MLRCSILRRGIVAYPGIEVGPSRNRSANTPTSPPAFRPGPFHSRFPFARIMPHCHYRILRAIQVNGVQIMRFAESALHSPTGGPFLLLAERVTKTESFPLVYCPLPSRPTVQHVDRVFGEGAWGSHFLQKGAPPHSLPLTLPSSPIQATHTWLRSLRTVHRCASRRARTRNKRSA